MTDGRFRLSGGGRSGRFTFLGGAAISGACATRLAPSGLSHPLRFFQGAFDMQTVNLVFVPYPVPVGNGVGWEKRVKPHPYPRHSPVNWSPRDPPRAVRDLLADAKRIVAERRASRLWRELDATRI